MKVGHPDELTSLPRGFLVIDKPSGISSRTAVDRVLRLLPKQKIGHAGTLDPLASGVLVICIGKATRLVDVVQNLAKSYRAVIRLGAISDTLDADGSITPRFEPRVPTEPEVRAALEPFSGEILQMPPAYSALKVNGRRAYEIARSGQSPALEARPIQIHRFEATRYEWPRLEVEIDCGKGTYVRSLARDLGESLGCGGYIEVLVRTRIGPFRIDDAVRLDELSPGSVLEHLRPEVDALSDMPRTTLDPEEVTAIAAGKRLTNRPPSETPFDPGPIALLDQAGRLIALAEYDALGYVQPRKVFC